jgi:ribosome biogenesis protein ENP2
MGNKHIYATDNFYRVKIYDLSSGKSLPEYMEEAKKKKIKLKHLEEYRNRIELIQDFDFSISSQRVRVSED